MKAVELPKTDCFVSPSVDNPWEPDHLHYTIVQVGIRTYVVAEYSGRCCHPSSTIEPQKHLWSPQFVVVSESMSYHEALKRHKQLMEDRLNAQKELRAKREKKS